MKKNQEKVSKKFNFKSKKSLKGALYAIGSFGLVAAPVALAASCDDGLELIDKPTNSTIDERYVQTLDGLKAKIDDLLKDRFEVSAVEFTEPVRNQVIFKIQAINIATRNPETIDVDISDINSADYSASEHLFRTLMRGYNNLASQEKIYSAYYLLQSGTLTWKEWVTDTQKRETNYLNEWLRLNESALNLTPAILQGAGPDKIEQSSFVINNNQDGKISIQNVIYSAPRGDVKTAVLTFDVVHGSVSKTITLNVRFDKSENEVKFQEKTNRLPATIRIIGKLTGQTVTTSDMGDSRPVTDQQGYIDNIITKYYQQVSGVNPFVGVRVTNVVKNSVFWNEQLGKYQISFEAAFGVATPKRVTILAEWERDIFNEWFINNVNLITINPTSATGGPLASLSASDIILPNNPANRYSVDRITYLPPVQDGKATEFGFDIFSPLDTTLRASAKTTITYAKSENEVKVDALPDLQIDGSLTTSITEVKMITLNSAIGDARISALFGLIDDYYRSITLTSPNTVNPFLGATITGIEINDQNINEWNPIAGIYKVVFRVRFGGSYERTINLNFTNILTNNQVDLQNQTNALPAVINIDGRKVATLNEQILTSISAATPQAIGLKIHDILREYYTFENTTTLNPFPSATISDFQQDSIKWSISAGTYTFTFKAKFGAASTPKIVTVNATNVISQDALDKIILAENALKAIIDSTKSKPDFNSEIVAQFTKFDTSSANNLGVAIPTLPDELDVVVNFRKAIGYDVVYQIVASRFNGWNRVIDVTMEKFTTLVALSSSFSEIQKAANENGVTLRREAVGSQKSGLIVSDLPFTSSTYRFEIARVSQTSSIATIDNPYATKVNFQVQARVLNNSTQTNIVDEIAQGSSVTWETNKGQNEQSSSRRDNFELIFNRNALESIKLNNNVMSVSNGNEYRVLLQNAQYVIVISQNRVVISASYTDLGTTNNGVLAYVTTISSSMLNPEALVHKETDITRLENAPTNVVIDGNVDTKIFSSDLISIFNAATDTDKALALKNLIAKKYEGVTNPFDRASYSALSFTGTWTIWDASFTMTFLVGFGNSATKSVTLSANNLKVGIVLGTVDNPINTINGTDFYYVNVGTNLTESSTKLKELINKTGLVDQTIVNQMQILSLNFDPTTPFGNQARTYTINFDANLTINGAQVRKSLILNSFFVSSHEEYIKLVEKYDNILGDDTRVSSTNYTTLRRTGIAAIASVNPKYTLTNYPVPGFLLNSNLKKRVAIDIFERPNTDDSPIDRPFVNSIPLAEVKTNDRVSIYFSTYTKDWRSNSNGTGGNVDASSVLNAHAPYNPALNLAQTAVSTTSIRRDQFALIIDNKQASSFTINGVPMQQVTINTPSGQDTGYWVMSGQYSDRNVWFGFDINPDGKIFFKTFYEQTQQGYREKGIFTWIEEIRSQVLKLKPTIKTDDEAPFDIIASDIVLSPDATIKNFSYTLPTGDTKIATANFTISRYGIDVANQMFIVFGASPNDKKRIDDLPNTIDIDGATRKDFLESDFVVVDLAANDTTRLNLLQEILRKYYLVANGNSSPFDNNLLVISDIRAIKTTTSDWDINAGNYSIRFKVVTGFYKGKEVNIIAKNILSNSQFVENTLKAQTETLKSKTVFDALTIASNTIFETATMNSLGINVVIPSDITVKVSKVAGVIVNYSILSNGVEVRNFSVTFTLFSTIFTLENKFASLTPDALDQRGVTLSRVGASMEDDILRASDPDQYRFHTNAFNEIVSGRATGYIDAEVAKVVGNQTTEIKFGLASKYEQRDLGSGLTDAFTQIKDYEGAWKNPSNLDGYKNAQQAAPLKNRYNDIKIVMENGTLKSITMDGVPMVETVINLPSGPISAYFIKLGTQKNSLTAIKIVNNTVRVGVLVENVGGEDGAFCAVYDLSARMIDDGTITYQNHSSTEERAISNLPSTLDVDGSIARSLTRDVIGLQNSTLNTTQTKSYINTIIDAYYKEQVSPSSTVLTTPFTNAAYNSLTRVASNWDMANGRYKITFNVKFGPALSKLVTINLENIRFKGEKINFYVGTAGAPASVPTDIFYAFRYADDLGVQHIFKVYKEGSVPQAMLQNFVTPYIVVKDLYNPGSPLASLTTNGAVPPLNITSYGDGIIGSTVLDSSKSHYIIDPNLSINGQSSVEITFVNYSKTRLSGIKFVPFTELNDGNHVLDYLAFGGSLFDGASISTYVDTTFLEDAGAWADVYLSDWNNREAS